MPLTEEIHLKPETDAEGLPRLLSNPLNMGRERKKVAVYGGAFDPITAAHLQCAAQIIHSKVADEVMLVPCGARPDKPKLKTSALDRYVMCCIAVNTIYNSQFPVSVSDAEIHESQSLATYDLLTILRDRHPECDFMFIIGSDWLQPGTCIRDWESKEGRTGDRLVEEFDFLVIKRPGYDCDSLTQFGPRFNWLKMPDGMVYIDSNLSSSEIRNRVITCKDQPDRLECVVGLVAVGVLSYIRRKGLYKE
eukprot:TRINITY_DN2258_c0_g1_i1.p1 TRINITY_DN2258_c0_g1~~TRINITY_DN2258_c0_g1_i1.p1  ORF type:complete len:249 (+),score=44.13 TRINITY_DN2258_c0_g1_i1:185-931(+)